MSWDTEIVTIVRHMIGDYNELDTTLQQYSDDKISQVILIAASHVNVAASFKDPGGSDITYAPSVENLTLRPDPTNATYRNEYYINLVSLRASVIIIKSEVRLNTKRSIRIRDGSSEIDLKIDAAGLRLMLEAYEEDYKDALFEYLRGESFAGFGIVGPYKVCGTYTDPYAFAKDWGSRTGRY